MKPVRFLLPCCLVTVMTPLHGAAPEGTDGLPLVTAGTKARINDPLNAAFDKALAAQLTKDFELALRLFHDAAALADRRSRPMSWMTVQFNICHTLSLMGEKDAAANAARQMVRDCEASFGSGDPLTSEALVHLAFVLQRQGRLADAEPVYRRNVRLLETKYGQDHYLVADAICRHGSLLQSLGRLKDAERQLRRALEIAQDATNAAGDPGDMCCYITHLAFCLHAQGKAEEAREQMEVAHAIVANSENAALASAGRILRRQAEYYRDIGELDRAEALARRGLLRLARRHDVNRAKFFHYDTVVEIFRSILRAKGSTAAEIAASIREIEVEAGEGSTAVAAETPEPSSAPAQ